MTKEILAQPDVWLVVEELAALLLERGSLERHELQRFFEMKSATRRDERIAVLFTFVNSFQAQLVSGDTPLGWTSNVQS